MKCFSAIAFLVLFHANVNAFTAVRSSTSVMSTKQANTALNAILDMATISAIDPALLAGGALATILGLGGAAVIGSLGGGNSSSKMSQVIVVEEPETIDISIPYDAAARLAYDQWRDANNKGDFDEGGFVAFKEIYEEATIGMVTYKQMARTLEAQKRTYEELAAKLEKLENVGWGQQPKNAL